MPEKGCIYSYQNCNKLFLPEKLRSPITELSKKLKSIPQKKWFEPLSLGIAASTVMALESVAAFNDAAYFLGYMTLCVVGFWLVLMALLWRYPRLLTGWPGSIKLAAALLGVFWIWVGLSVYWSIAADLSWTEFNRTGGYFAVFLVGIALGRSKVARWLSTGLFLLLVTTTALYALASKVLPALVENIEQAARIAVPIGYTNALGLFLALAVPLALYVTVNKGLPWGVRLAAVPMLPILFTCEFFISSRGAMLALLVGLSVFMIAAPLRLRTAGMLALTLAVVLPLFRWSFGQDALMKGHVPLDERLAAAAPLRLYLLLVIVAVMAVFSVALIIGKYSRFPRLVTRGLGLLLGVALLAAIFAVSVNFIDSKPDFRQWASEAYENFTAKNPNRDNSLRLLDLDASGRWPLWREAMANWQESPLRGSGAQTFPLVHLLRREEGVTFVKQPHGLPFRLLGELGLVGFVLMGGFIALTAGLAAKGVQKINDRWERGLAAAWLSLSVIYLIQTAYDWAWNMLALTVPYFFFVGLLLGWTRFVKGGPKRLLLLEAAPQDRPYANDR